MIEKNECQVHNCPYCRAIEVRIKEMELKLLKSAMQGHLDVIALDNGRKRQEKAQECRNEINSYQEKNINERL